MCVLTILVVFLILVIVVIIIKRGYMEGFDNNNTSDFLPLGSQRYDLRGFPVYNRPIYDCWYDNYHNCYNSHY